jgi:hypothetical protein
VLLSGDVLGDIKLVDAGEMEFAIDAECTCEMLLRAVFAARGLHDTCDVRGKPVAHTSIHITLQGGRVTLIPFMTEKGRGTTRTTSTFYMS